MTFTLRVRNNGPSAATSVVLTDPMPNGFVITSIPQIPAGWNCAPAAGGTQLDCTVSSLAANSGPVEIKVTARVPTTGPSSAGTVVNTATVTSAVTDPETDNNTASTSLQVLPDGADLAMGKTKAPELVPAWSAGQPKADSMMTSTMTVTNRGPRAATDGVQIVDELAVGEQLVDSDGTEIAPNVPFDPDGSGRWSCVATPYLTGTRQRVTCDMVIGYPLASGATSPALVLHTLALESGTLTNTACTGGSGGSRHPITTGGVNLDPNDQNNCAGGSSRSTEQFADLSIQKRTNAVGEADNVLPVNQDTVEYTLTVTNSAASGATGGLIVADPIPGFVPNVTSVTGTAPSGWTCGLLSNVWTCRSDVGYTLAPGASVQFNITVKRGLIDSVGVAGDPRCGGIAGRHCNTAQVRIDTSHPDALGELNGGKTASDWVSISPVTNVSTRKAITAGNPGRVGTESAYSITYNNDHTSVAPGVIFRDTFTLKAGEAGFVLVSANRTGGGGATCTVVTPLAAGIVQAPSSVSGQFSYSNPSGADALLQISCPAIDMGRGATETMSVVIRPNIDSGNTTGRSLYNMADFGFTGPSNGAEFEYNSDPNDDKSEATLSFDQGSVDLITNKVDAGFAGAIDPLGFDSRPGNGANNRVIYRIEVTNNGPSLATNVIIDDTITPPTRTTGVPVELEFMGSRTGDINGPSGALEAPGMAARCYGTSALGTSTSGQPLPIRCTMPAAGANIVTDGVIRSGAKSYLYLVYEYKTAPPGSGETLSNQATASSAENEINAANNSDGENTSIRTRVDLGVTKTAHEEQPAGVPSVALPADAGPLSLRQPFWYVLEVVNNGPGHALNRSATELGASVTDTLPAGLEVIGGAPAITWEKIGGAIANEPAAEPTGGGTCSLSNLTITCGLGDMSVDGKARILIPVRWITYPAGGKATNTATVATSQIDSDPGNNTDDVEVTVVRSSLAGTVFHDRDRSAGNGGIQNGAAEAGIPGIKLVLSGVDIYGENISTYLTTAQREKTTDGSGNFKFEGLVAAGPAGYTLVETQSTAYVNGDVDPPVAGQPEGPTQGGVYAQVDPANVRTSNSQYTAIALGKAADGIDYNFPEIRRPTLSGYVFVDLDENDIRTTTGAVDPAIVGATVILQDALGNEIATQATNSNGRYQFTNLDPLVEYVLVQPLPTPNYINRPTAVKAGTFNNAACAAGTCVVENRTADEDAITKIGMLAGYDGVDFNFGEQALSDISGYVYVDRDLDGKFDPTKDNDVNNTGTSQPNGGLQGIVVVLTPYNRAGVAQAPVEATTDANGFYEFPDLQAGLRYTLHEKQQPVGYADAAENPIGTPINIPVLSVNGAVDNNFGEKLASLAGLVFEDFSATTANNNNGVRDAGENPIPNVTLTLTGSDINGAPVNRTTTTTSTGTYVFADLLEGDYTITQTQPADYEDGKHTAGNATTPGSNAVANVISGIGVDAGQDATSYLFGELKKTTISGTVYLDRDDDGSQNNGEPGIPGVTITLEQETSPGVWTPVVTTTPIVTDANGGYEYTEGVIGKNYRITETQPTGLADGQENTSNIITITNLSVDGSQGNNFGEKAAVVSGVVYLDSNNNGVRDAGEPALAGVQVTLSAAAASTNALGQALTTVATTDANGAYSFGDLLADTYTVTEQTAQPIYSGNETSNGITSAGTIDGAAVGTATAVTVVPSVISGIVLPAGKASIDNNFGEILEASISGSVYVDRNANGSFDAGDAGTINSQANGGLEGVWVVLYDANDNELTRVQTDAQGGYSFGNLLVGVDYRIAELQPDGYANGSENPGNTITVSQLPVTGSAGNNFGEKLGSLAGVVYEDFSSTAATNNNGTQDAGENPIAGVSLTLTGTDVNGTPVNRTVTTDANGAYAFGDLIEGNYTITETQPVDYIDGKHTAGNATTAGSNAVANVISGIGLDAGQDATGYLFGELKQATIEGTVYLDRDDNGSQNGSEPGIAGVTITLEVETTPGNWTPVVTSTPIVTDANGHYEYADGVIGRNYRITETQPTGLADGQENNSNVITITNLLVTGSQGNNFGEKAASLSGVVYLDSNNNGIQDGGEPGLPNVEVSLPAGTLDALGNAVAVASTDADGNYVFNDLLAGTYTVTEQAAQPSYGGVVTFNGITTAGSTGGTATSVTTVPSAISGIALVAGGTSERNNFGEILVAAISGTVYVDRNDNGSFDAADAGGTNSAPNGGIVGVEVVLYAADGTTEVARTNTDAQGNYSFADLPTGVGYVVKQTQPTGYAQGQENPGDEITIITLPLNGSTGNNFGEKLGALAGFVYEDFSGNAANNNNGSMDAGEAAIAGVTLTLTGTDANGAPVSRTATTDNSGAYSFGDLLQGTYTITETQPNGYIDGKHTVGNATTAGSNAVANVLSGIGLGAGENASGYLFGELANAPISGTVYIDRNNDGKQDADEPGVPNVSITIEVEDSPGNWIAVPGQAIVTDANGHYTYPDAVTGKNYRITETQPVELGDGKENGTVNTGTANVITINNLPTTGSTGNNFGEIAALLSGVVFLDSNNNGIQDAGEPGLPNVEVELPAGTRDAAGQVVAKALTDADGRYQFIDLLAGTYTVTEQAAQPSYNGVVTFNGITTAGSTGGTATGVGTVPSAISGIVLAAGGTSEGNNFGEILVAGISGTVYVDRNDNGSFDAGDAGSNNSAANGGIVGVEVVLYAADGTTELARTVTDAQGNYSFADLPTGVGYVIKQTQPAGYAAGQENPGNEITITTLPLDGSSDNNYGEKLAGLSGFVYEDFSATAANNNNGAMDAGEAAIAGVTLTLTGTDANGAPVSRTAVTDANGAYSFGDLLQGTYTITETQPAGYEDGKHTVGNATTAGSNAVANVISGIGLDAGQLAEGYLFGELKKAPISGTVYIDRNDDGSQDPTEPGIGGVEIVITSNGPDGQPGGGDDVNVTITTNADGSYSWPDALPGVDYTITQKQPQGLADGKENTSNVITISNLPATGSDNNNFGEKAAVLSGVVYLDSNNNGIRDAGEPGLANVEVSLPASVQNVLGQGALTATTDADGNYVFQDLLAGTYAVTQQVAQPSYNGAPTINGITTAGSTGGTATPVATVPSAINGIALSAGGTSENNNFGEVLQVSISGAVFLDVNNDGAMLGAGETGLEGVVIELSGVDDSGVTVNLSTTTDADGKFSFEGLRPGKYSLVEPTQPNGTANGITTAGTVDGTATGTATSVTTVPSRIGDIDLSVPGTASVDNLFGEIPRSSAISGKVWEDTNNDGVVDPGEKGIAGVIVELEGTAVDGTPITLSVTTDADGNYSFDELPPGTYTVTEPNQPPGTLDGKTVPGSTGGTATAPGTTPSKISTIVVGVNETSRENNFGEVPVGSIAGFVYNDSNDDGIKQNDEGGYAMIDVVLTGTDDLGNPVNVPGVTDAQGHYVFENLRPGTYTVTEPTQPAETLNGLTTAGTIDGVKSTARVTGKDTVPSEIDGIVLRPGNNSVDNNFGEIGDSPDMLVSKSSNSVKFTVNNVASYTIRVRNGGQKASFGEYIVKDRLPVGLTLADVPAGSNWTCSGAVGDSRFECRSSEVVSAGTTSLSDITVRVNVGIEAANAGTVNNAVLIEGGGENEFRTPTVAERNTFEGNVADLPVCDTAITQNVCRVPNQVQLASSVGGTVWFDVGSEDTFLDAGDERLQSWIVELVDSSTGAVSQSTVTAVDGSYRFADVIPGVKWNIQFRDPSSGVLWAWPVNQETAGGMGVACDGPRAIDNNGVSACRVTENGTSQLQVVLEAGQHLPQQSLPVDPSGVVYDAVTRDPVPGSIVTLSPVGVCTGYDPLTAILNAGAGGYRVEGNAVSMTVGNSGYYQFTFGPAAPARCEFQLTVTPPGGYQFVSSLIPPQGGTLSPLGAAGSSHQVQPQTGAPTGAVGTPTQYWLTLFAGSAVAGVVHNHIPLDTAEATGLVITKTGDRQTAEIGDTVQYTITVRQTAGSAMATVNVVDTLPRGFTYIDGTGRVGGRAIADPVGKPGPRLGFDLGPINVGQQLVLTYRVRVGVGAQQGDGINRAQAHGCSITGGCIDPGSMTPVPGSVPSNRAEYRVRVTGGVFTEEACVLGKVFVDCNNNHVQDEEELGIPGVRLYFSNGTWVISDSEGKYSYCGLTPQSHTLKVDPSTLPVGSRLTTSSNRNLGDADSLFLDLKNGELHRADFIEGSCANPLLEQVKARRTQGEVRAPETETGQSQLRFDSKPARAPQQATDSSNQGPIVQPRPNPPSAAASQEVQP